MRLSIRSLGSFARPAALAACLIAGWSRPVHGQQPLAEAPTTPEFFPRYDFRMSAAALSYDDPRFSWDIHWAGDFDLVDYVWGRALFLADYQTLLGSEFRPFDPYQSNYTLEASGSVRAGGVEIALVLNHVSRHLGDRPKRIAVADNSLGGRVLKQFVVAPATIDLRADLRGVIERAYVDYSWIADAEAWVRRPVRERVAVYGRGTTTIYGVDPAVADRGTQVGARVEGGIRLGGKGGGVELFGGWERMVDADPLDRLARSWAFAGFRLVNR